MDYIKKLRANIIYKEMEAKKVGKNIIRIIKLTYMEVSQMHFNLLNQTRVLINIITIYLPSNF